MEERRKGSNLALYAVGAVLLVGAAAVVPSLLRKPFICEGPGAISSMRTIATSEQSYKTTEGSNRFGTLAQMSATSPRFVDSVLGSGTKSGYTFDLKVGADGQTFTCRAAPARFGVTGNRCFWTDTSGVIRQGPDRRVDGQSSPID